MNDKKKTSYHHGNLRQAMLRAADVILADDGLTALTLRACARAAGVSHAAPAHHFGDLKGLWTALATESFKMLGDKTEALRLAHQTSPDQVFGALGRLYVGFARQHPDRFRLMMRADLVDYRNEDFHDAAKRCFGSMTNIIALASGHPPTTLAEMSASAENRLLAQNVVLTWSLIHGFAHLRIEENFNTFADHMGGRRFDDLTWDDIGRRIGTLLRSKP